jgi:hypothetical protein
MEYRGHILIVFALSLIASPYAIKRVMASDEEQAAAVVPQAVTTVGAAQAACEDQSITTAIGRLGCVNSAASGVVRNIELTSATTQNETRRLANGGAMFVSARK